MFLFTRNYKNIVNRLHPNIKCFWCSKKEGSILNTLLMAVIASQVNIL